MLNSKIYEIYGAIEKALMQELPLEYIKLLFDKKINIDDVIMQALFDCCEYAYSKSAEKNSLREYRKRQTNEYEAGDARRMKFQRIAENLNKKNDELYNYVQREYENYPMSRIAFQKNEKQYLINELEYKNIENIADIPLLKILLDKKFLSEKFYNDKFESASNEYDIALEKLQKTARTEKEYVLNHFDVEKVEQDFYFDFMYEIVDEMEKSEVREIPQSKDRFIQFCYQPKIKSVLSYYKKWNSIPEIPINRQAILLRKKFIQEIVLLPEGDIYDIWKVKYLESLYLIVFFRTAIEYKGIPLQKWFCMNTNMDDWFSICETYNVYQAYVPKKEWTNKKIRYAKNIYKEMLFNYTK